MSKLVYSVIFLFCSFVYSQNSARFKIDSLKSILPKMKNDTSKVSTWNRLAHEYRKIDPDSGIIYANKAYLLSKDLKWNDGIALSLRAIAVSYTNSSEFDKARIYYNKAAKFTTNKKIMLLLYRGLGVTYALQNNNAEALKFGNLSLKICEQIGDKNGEATALTNIGVIYMKLNDDKTALNYYKKSLKINEKLNDKSILLNNLTNIAISYSSLEYYEKAIEVYDQVIVLADELGNKAVKATALDSKAQTYYYLNNFDKAMLYTKESLQINEEIGNENLKATNLMIIGQIYNEKAKVESNKSKRANLFNLATTYLNQSLEIKKEIGALELISLNYGILSEVEKSNGNYKKALEYYENFKAYNDSIYNQESKETIQNLEDKRTIELSQRQLEINRLTIETKEKQKTVYIIGLIFLSIIGSLLFYQSQNRKKTNYKLQILNTELDKANKIKAKFFSILNHDLRSPVYNLIHFLHLQKENPELLTEESKERIEAKTLSSVENLLISMEDMLLWSKGQMENFKPQPKQVYISALLNDVKNHFESEEKVQIIFENPENIQVNTDEDYLKTIIRNLTGNAIKALEKTQSPTIVWKSWHVNGHDYLSISDNGPGANQEQFKAMYDEREVVGIQSGLGLHLIRDLAKAIQIEITVQSLIEKGTTFTLKF